MASPWNLAAKKAEETTSSVSDAVSNTAAQVVEAGTSLWQSVVDEAADALASGKEAVVDVAEDVFEALPEMEDVVETVETVGTSVQGAMDSVNELGSDIVSGGFGTSEFRLFLKNLFKPSGTVTESALNSKDIETLRRIVANAKAAGRSYVKYKEDLGVDEGNVLKEGMLEGLFNPELRMARTTGVFNFEEDEEGNTIISNTYDFNGGRKRDAFHEARNEGDAEKAFNILMDSIRNPVELASIIAYDIQEQRRDAGEPATTELRINLGKIE